MTDRELLEKAAKAAGVELRRYAIKPAQGEGDGLIGYMTDPEQWPRGWFDPLTDDGDALRLAAKLKLNIMQGDFSVEVNDEAEIAEAALVREDGDRLSVLRRAIVRAAASIGGSS